MTSSCGFLLFGELQKMKAAAGTRSYIGAIHPGAGLGSRDHTSMPIARPSPTSIWSAAKPGSETGVRVHFPTR